MKTAVSRALSLICGSGGRPHLPLACSWADDEDGRGLVLRENCLPNSATEFMMSTPHSLAFFRIDSGSDVSFCVSRSSLARRDLVEDLVVVPLVPFGSFVCAADRSFSLL